MACEVKQNGATGFSNDNSARQNQAEMNTIPVYAAEVLEAARVLMLISDVSVR